MRQRLYFRARLCTIIDTAGEMRGPGGKEEVNQSALVLKWGPNETQGGSLGIPDPVQLLAGVVATSVPGLQRPPGRPGTTISVVHIHLNNAHLHFNCFIGIQLKLTFLPTLEPKG